MSHPYTAGKHIQVVKSSSVVKSADGCGLSLGGNTFLPCLHKFKVWNRAVSVLKSGWINVDADTQISAPKPSLIIICRTQGTLFWAREFSAAQACPGLSC